MPTLNLLVFLNAYNDSHSSNVPSHNNFRWTRDINGLSVGNPVSISAQLAANETRTIFSGTAVKKILYVEADQNCTLLITGYASFTGTLSGTATPVTIKASVAGTAGNSIALVFNGSNTIAAAISTWNTANPSNTATLVSGVGTQIPSAQTLTLNGNQSVHLMPLVLGTFADGSPNNTPGMFIRTDAMAVLQVTNEGSTTPCNIFVATVE